MLQILFMVELRMPYGIGCEMPSSYTLLLEILGSIVFAKELCLPSDTRQSIAWARTRLCLDDLAIVQRWMDIVRARIVEDYTKVNETLFVEMWPVRKKGKLHSPHKLLTSISRREDIDMNMTAAVTYEDVENDVDTARGPTPHPFEVLVVALLDLWERMEVRMHKLKVKRGGGMVDWLLSKTIPRMGALDEVEANKHRDVNMANAMVKKSVFKICT